MTRRLGALGGPHTFGGQAARLMVDARPDLGEVAYLPNSKALFADDGHWRVDASCVPANTTRTGAHLSTHRRLADRPDLYAVAEVEHAYHCALLVRPGTRLDAIRQVLGHTGSINQSRDWLREQLPAAEVTVVDTHSLGAALTVASGDGSVAAVGTTDLARETGLEVLQTDLDGGSVGRYWAVGPQPRLADRPDRVVVSSGDSTAQKLTAALRLLYVAGCGVVSVWNEPWPDQPAQSRVVIYASTAADSDVKILTAGLELIPGFRVAGAYQLRTDVMTDLGGPARRNPATVRR